MTSLHGLKVVVTRAAHQAEELAGPLRELGAQVFLLPMIEIAGPEDPGPLKRAAANCNRYHWIIFTSVNAVEAFVHELPGGVLCSSSIATVGEATRAACERHGLSVVLTPARYVAEALLTAFNGYDLRDSQVLIPSAAVTRDVIPLELKKLGARVNVVEAYRNIVPADAKARVHETLREPYPDWLLFASSSAVRNLVEIAGTGILNRMRIATIGPVTTATARRLSLKVAAEAETYDMQGLINVILANR